MFGMKHPFRKMLSLSLAVVTAASMTMTAYADEPYKSYNYDNWDDAIPSQCAYEVDRTLTGQNLQLTRLKDPSDPLFISENESSSFNDARDLSLDDERDELWVADTMNNRILVFDVEKYELKACYKSVSGSDVANLKRPYGVFAHTSPSTGKQTVYICDSENSRVVKAEVKDNKTLEVIHEYKRPEEALYTASTYSPRKVCVDKAENVYVICNGVNTGSVQFSKDGKFLSFFGANRVQVTAAVIAQRIWRAIASETQLAGMKRNVPIEYVNFDIDKDGFIYTVTEVDVETDQLKKLNAAGFNIWNNNRGNTYVFGDVQGEQWDPVQRTNHHAILTDCDISPDGIISVLDFESGRVFQYDKECNLICIFGTKNATSEQRGTMKNPNAIETRGDKVYLLDGAKNDITVYTETQFGHYLKKAFKKYDEGLYVEAKEDWNQVIRRDGCYTMAYIGLGKAALKEEQYSKALKYFKTAYDQDDYDKAYKYAREAFLREHFTAIIVIIAVLIVLLKVKGHLNKKGIYLIKRKKKKTGLRPVTEREE